MIYMDEQIILRVLSNEFNTQWENGKVSGNRLQPFRRRDFYPLVEQIKNPKVTSIIGPRRVGKTTLLFQLISHLIDEGVGPKRILYASLDNAYLKNAADEVIGDILGVYSKFVLKEDLRKLKDQVYVFFDEVQYVDEWQKKIKSWYDYRYKIKFIVSGSSSAMIQKGATHLVGRIHERLVLPLKFSDMLDCNNKDREYFPLSKQIRDSFALSVEKRNEKHFCKTIEDISYELAKRENEMERILQGYMIKGGYPELLGNNDYDACASELKDTILSKSILDIVERHGIRDISLLRYIIALIASKSGSILTQNGIAQDLGVQRPTVVSHLEYLENAFLVSRSSFYSKRLPTRERKEKKYYMNDVGMRNSMVGMMNDMLLKSPEIGHVAETLAFDHTRRLKFFISGHQNVDVFYWRSDYGEIDMILDPGPIPIEVKYQSKVDDSDSKTMKDFMSKHKSPFGIVVTRNELDLSDNILRIPLRVYLLMC